MNQKKEKITNNFPYEISFLKLNFPFHFLSRNCFSGYDAYEIKGKRCRCNLKNQLPLSRVKSFDIKYLKLACKNELDFKKLKANDNLRRGPVSPAVVFHVQKSKVWLETLERSQRMSERDAFVLTSRARRPETNIDRRAGGLRKCVYEFLSLSLFTSQRLVVSSSSTTNCVVHKASQGL
jgi:hypothetical protein